MTENYKVIKLRSGEELIAEVVGSDDGKVTLLKPMVFKTIVMQDPMGIAEGIVLKNSLTFGNQKETTIPSDFIATTLEPTKDVMTYYLAEKDREDVLYQKTPVEEFAGNKENKEDQKKISNQEVEKMLSDIFGQIFGEEEEPKKVKRSKKNKEEIIHMNMVFSPEALAHMINEGMIDPRDIMDMIRHFELDKPKRKKKNRESINDKKFTGEEKDRKDFGNKWTDWNPDPNSNDYK